MNVLNFFKGPFDYTIEDKNGYTFDLLCTHGEDSFYVVLETTEEYTPVETAVTSAGYNSLEYGGYRMYHGESIQVIFDNEGEPIELSEEIKAEILTLIDFHHDPEG